jgi:PIN domain nuclease of toxin-antitoxin system
MRLLLDSHILIALTRRETASLPEIHQLLQSSASQIFVSTASLWEIAIKFRFAKLKLLQPPGAFPAYFQSLGYQLLAVDHRHAVENLQTQPATRDPFDRMLLAQCQIEGLQLVTIDRALVGHPLAWRAA